jgi:hypothetical protein
VGGLHIVSDILTKISANMGDKFTCCIVIYMLIFMSLSMCVYNCLSIYGYFLYMLHVYVYCHFSMNPCIYIMYLSIYIFIYICFHRSSMCICILIACSSKSLCGIAQLDVGYVTICSAERT